MIPKHLETEVLAAAIKNREPDVADRLRQRAELDVKRLGCVSAAVLALQRQLGGGAPGRAAKKPPP